MQAEEEKRKKYFHEKKVRKAQKKHEVNPKP
jgi:hypothetical protein